MYQLIDVVNNNQPIHKPTMHGEPTEPWTFETREQAFEGAGVLGYKHVWNNCFLPVDGEIKHKTKRPIWLKLKEV